MKASQQFLPGRLRVWLNVFSVFLGILLLLLTTGCDGGAPGNTSQPDEQATTCNVPLFEQVRFSTAHQDGKVLYTSYATDTTFSQVGVVAQSSLTHQLLWQDSFSVNANAAMRLTSTNGIVYALFQRANTDWSWLFALDAQTGQQLWTYNEEGAGDLAACNGVLVLVGNWRLRVFASKTGKLLWSFGQPDRQERLGSSLAITRDALYFISIALGGNEQAMVHAMGLQDGTTRWRAPLPPQNDSAFGTVGSLTLTPQALYVLQSSLEAPGLLVALRPQDGAQIWNTTSGPDEKILMVSNQTLYLANTWEVEDIQTTNGKPLWSHRFSQSAIIFVGASQHGLFISQYAASFCSLDLANGNTRWCLQLPLLEWEGTPFFIDSATIYLFSQGNHSHPDDSHPLYVVDKQTGKARAQFTIHSLAGAITTL